MNKNLLLAAAFVFCATINATPENDNNNSASSFTPKSCSLTYTVTVGKNQSTADFYDSVLAIRTIINSQYKSVPSLYQNLLIFIKELQEAIVAGLNLFSSASVSQESLIEVVQDIAVDAAQATFDNAVSNITSETTSLVDATVNHVTDKLPFKSVDTDNITESFAVTYAVVADTEEKVSALETIKAEMDVLADSINRQSNSDQEQREMFKKMVTLE